MERISSRQNAHFKLARRLLGSARERAKARMTLLEGGRLVNAYARRFGLRDAVLLIRERPDPGGDQDPMGRFGLAKPTKGYLVADALFSDISPVDTSEGIVALVPIPDPGTDEPGDFRVLLDGVQDPGNLGGLLRTAAAAGATSAYLGMGCADAWSPKSLRGGMGAQFVMPVYEKANLGAALEGFSGTVLATIPRAKVSIFDVCLTGPVAMIFGSEGRGVSEEVLALANRLVGIPMSEQVESLNVAAAAAVCCFERLRQKNAAIPGTPQ